MIRDIKTDSQYIAIKADSDDIHLGTSGIKNDFSFLIPTSSKKLVGQEELESSTFAVSERHSNQLNY